MGNVLDENIKAPADCELRLWDGNWIYKLKYDFDTIISRRGTNSYKWDTPEEEKCTAHVGGGYGFSFLAPAIIDALQSGWRTVFSVIQKYPKPIMMHRLSGGSMTGIAGRVDSGGLSIRVVSCRLCQPLSKPWPCR